MPVCIAGMHRSGTSMVAKMLQISGLYLGSETDLAPSNPTKSEGHWENKRFVRVNNSLLEQLHGWWDAPPAPPVDWTGERFAGQRGEALKVLDGFAGREPWGWKDPRTCLTLPFWQSLLGPLPVVIVVRNPLEVALSLRKRNGFSCALGVSLWHAYNQRLWDEADSSARIVTHYDTYSADAASEVRRLLAFLGQPIDEQIIDDVRAVHNPEMRRHGATMQDLRAANVAPNTVALYRMLCEEAGVPLVDADAASPDSQDPVLTAAWQSANESAPEGRPDRNAARSGRPQRRRLLEDAEDRIAELEQTVAAQRSALARYEAGERPTAPPQPEGC